MFYSILIRNNCVISCAREKETNRALKRRTFKPRPITEN